MAKERRALTTASEIAGIIGTIVAIVALLLSLTSHGGVNAPDAASTRPSASARAAAQSPVPASQVTTPGKAATGATATSRPRLPALIPAPTPTSQHPLGYALLLALAVLLGSFLCVIGIKSVIIDDEPTSGVKLLSGIIHSAAWIALLIFLGVGPIAIVAYAVHYLRHNSLTSPATYGLYALWAAAAAGGVAAGIMAVNKRDPDRSKAR